MAERRPLSGVPAFAGMTVKDVGGVQSESFHKRRNIKQPIHKDLVEFITVNAVSSDVASVLPLIGKCYPDPKLGLEYTIQTPLYQVIINGLTIRFGSKTLYFTSFKNPSSTLHNPRPSFISSRPRDKHFTAKYIVSYLWLTCGD